MTAPILLILRALLRGAEIAQIRRLLAFAGGHQVAVAAEKIILLANDNVHVALGAVVLRPPHIAVATITFHDGPRPRQRAVGRGDFVVQDVRIGLVEENPLPDDGLAVLRKWNAGLVVSARRLDVAGLDP